MRYDRSRLTEKLASGKDCVDYIRKDIKLVPKNFTVDDLIVFRVKSNFLDYSEFIISILEHLIAKNNLYKEGMIAKDYVDKGYEMGLYEETLQLEIIISM